MEDQTPYAVTALGWWRTDLPKPANDAYWRDIHGTLAARIPGIGQYRQLHLGTPQGGPLFLADLDDSLPAEPVDGIAQLLFATASNLRTFASHPFVTEYVFHDERNLVRRNATLPSAPGAARTLVDSTDDATPQGVPAQPTYAVMLQQRDDVDRDAFHQRAGEIAQRWSDSPGVSRLRWTPMEPYDEAGWQSPGVRHDWPDAEQYQAWVELVVADDDALAALPPLDPDVVREKYTIVHGGRPTDVGLRGWPAVQTITRSGATNQLQPDLLRALYGPVVDGAQP
jgi:hypothetical protein